VVVMSNHDKPLAVGGHNLRAAATQLTLDQQVPAGTIRIIGKSVRLNGADIDRAPFLVREAARGMRSGEPPRALEARLSSLLERTPLRPPRPPVEALKFMKGTLPDRIPPSAGVLSAATNRVPAEVLAMIGDASYSPQRIVIVRQGNHFWVAGPAGVPPVPTSNLADASEFASLRARATGLGRGGARRPAEFQFSNLNDADLDVMLNNLRANAGRRGYSEDVVAVVGKERPGFRSLRLADYDFKNPKIFVEPSQIIDGQRVSKVRVELTPKRTGLRKAVIEFWIRVKEAISEIQLTNITRAIKIRVERMFARIKTGEGMAEMDPLVQLQADINRIKQKFNVDIETHIRDASQDWRLVLTDSVAPHA
jgi:hypothetical protein